MGSDELLIATGLAAFASLKRENRKTFARWIMVGEGLLAGKRVLMERLQVNRLDSVTQKQQAYSRWLKESGYAAVPKKARVSLYKILDDQSRDTLIAWYKALPEQQQLRWNHPETVWHHWLIHTRQPSRPMLRQLAGFAIRSDIGPVVTLPVRPADVELPVYIGFMRELVVFLAKNFDIDAADVVNMLDDEVMAQFLKDAA
jgi:hypothetical protein